jgi:hypothetical protein
MHSSHQLNLWPITRECVKHMTPAAPLRICLNKCRTDEPMIRQGSNLMGSNRSLTSCTPSFSTQESTEMHARSGENTTFWRKHGKISKLTSQPSIDYTVSKLKQHNQRGTNHQITLNEACKMRYWWKSQKLWPWWQHRVQQIGPLCPICSHLMPKPQIIHQQRQT